VDNPITKPPDLLLKISAAPDLAVSFAAQKTSQGLAPPFSIQRKAQAPSPELGVALFARPCWLLFAGKLEICPVQQSEEVAIRHFDREYGDSKD
jgi:hypothetical protein